VASPGIVVGIDGSPAAGAALLHALEQARLRSLPLRIVCAWEIPAIEYAGAAFAPSPEYSLEAEHNAEGVLAAALEQLGPDPGVEVETEAIRGHPASILLEEARTARLVVVGTRGRAALTGLVLGSVSQAVAHHCPAPLLIVPAPLETGSAPQP
jgi:nucleotide-binding universal stress UspA family protein